VREPQKSAVSSVQATAENLVIGGGLAGAMAAMRLAAAGRNVVLLEKEFRPHHKVCGEFLSPEAIEYLRQAGVEPLTLGAVQIRFLRLSVKNTIVEAQLPFTALSLSRQALDEALLVRAGELGCVVRRGSSAERLTRNQGRWAVELGGGESLCAGTVFLATGKHDLRGWNRAPGAHNDLVGFKLHWRLAPKQTEALRDFMDLFLFRGGYGGLSLVEDDTANLCLVVRRSELRKLGGWGELLAALLNQNRHMRMRLEDAQPLWERPLAISSIPYGYLSGRPEGVWCVGDQAAVIPSFTGDGMSIALHSGALAAQMYIKGVSAEHYHRALELQLKRGMSLATLLSRSMVTTVGRELAPLGLSLVPNAMGWIARATRIPKNALLRCGETTPSPHPEAPVPTGTNS
jgi:flavin-dependent dehydrogenase